MLLMVPGAARAGSVRQPPARLRPAAHLHFGHHHPADGAGADQVGRFGQAVVPAGLEAEAEPDPAARHSSTQRRASGTVSARGLSQSTCLPASAAAITCPACSALGVAMYTAT